MTLRFIVCPRKRIASALAILLLVGICTSVVMLWERKSGQDHLDQLLESILVDCQNKGGNTWYCFDTHLRPLVDAHPPSDLVARLGKIVDNNSSLWVQCHTATHIIGRLAAAKFKTPFEMFDVDSYVCDAGYQHGLFEALLINENDVNKLSSTICAPPHPDTSPSAEGNCAHSVGHGAFVALNYDLPKAVAFCARLPNRLQISNCYDGVFMENAGTLGGGTRNGVPPPSKSYVNPADPQFPCTIFTDALQQERCWAKQPFVLETLFGTDYRKAFAVCDLAQTENNIHNCYHNLALRMTLRHPLPYFPIAGWKDALLRCNEVSNAQYLSFCFGGVIGYFTRNVPKLDDVFTFCFAVPPEAKNQCYMQLGHEIYWRYHNADVKRAWCQKSEAEFMGVCSRAAGV